MTSPPLPVISSEQKMYYHLLYSKLSSPLSSLDGCSVVKCVESPVSYDIEVKKADHPTIRIENKTFQQMLSSQEVEKFERGLESTDNHGILCSHHSSIDGRSDLQFRCMSTGKWVVYLAQLEYDVDTVVAVMHLLYKLDQTPHVQALTISRSAIKQLQDTIKRSEAQLEDLNKWMLDGQKMLDEWTSRDIGRLLKSTSLRDYV